MKSETVLKGTVGIEARTYENRIDLSEVKLEDGIEYIGERAFRNCKNLTYVEVPASCTRIDAYAFEGCEKLRWISFSPRGKRVKIHTRAFYKTGLKELKLPATCITFDAYELGRFRGMLYPTYYQTLRNLFSYPYEAEREEAKKTLNKLYFYYDTNRDGYLVGKLEGDWMSERLIIPEKIEDRLVLGIAKEAFKNWDFSSVILPYTCRYIGENAFENCYWLEHVGVYFDPNEIEIHPNAFKNCPKMSKDKITFLKKEEEEKDDSNDRN